MIRDAPRALRMKANALRWARCYRRGGGVPRHLALGETCVYEFLPKRRHLRGWAGWTGSEGRNKQSC